VRKLFRRLFGVGVLAGIGYAIWRYFERQRSESGVGWEAQPFPYPPQPREPSGASASAPHVPSQVAPPGGPETEGVTGAEWVEPNGHSCPASHPVKAKMSSKIFHVPGGANYDRTNPDRCYRDEAAAEADGLRKAAR
jgi:hypothetical protein